MITSILIAWCLPGLLGMFFYLLARWLLDFAWHRSRYHVTPLALLIGFLAGSFLGWFALIISLICFFFAIGACLTRWVPWTKPL